MRPQQHLINSQKMKSDKSKQFAMNKANAESKYKAMVPKPSDVFGIQLSLNLVERK